MKKDLKENIQKALQAEIRKEGMWDDASDAMSGFGQGLMNIPRSIRGQMDLGSANKKLERTAKRMQKDWEKAKAHVDTKSKKMENSKHPQVSQMGQQVQQNVSAIDQTMMNAISNIHKLTELGADTPKMEQGRSTDDPQFNDWIKRWFPEDEWTGPSKNSWKPAFMALLQAGIDPMATDPKDWAGLTLQSDKDDILKHAKQLGLDVSDGEGENEEGSEETPTPPPTAQTPGTQSSSRRGGGTRRVSMRDFLGGEESSEDPRQSEPPSSPQQGPAQAQAQTPEEQQTQRSAPGPQRPSNDPSGWRTDSGMDGPPRASQTPPGAPTPRAQSPYEAPPTTLDPKQREEQLPLPDLRPQEKVDQDLGRRMYQQLLQGLESRQDGAVTDQQKKAAAHRAQEQLYKLSAKKKGSSSSQKEVELPPKKVSKEKTEAELEEELPLPSFADHMAAQGVGGEESAEQDPVPLTKVKKYGNTPQMSLSKNLEDVMSKREKEAGQRMSKKIPPVGSVPVEEKINPESGEEEIQVGVDPREDPEGEGVSGTTLAKDKRFEKKPKKKRRPSSRRKK